MPVKQGRPKMMQDSRVISVRVPVDLVYALRSASKATGVPVSGYIRKYMLEGYTAEFNSPPLPIKKGKAGG